MQIYPPSTLTKGARGTFFETMAGERSSYVDLLATRVQSTARTEDYPWLGEPPQMTEIVDEIVYTGLSDTNYQLTNTEYGAGLKFHKRDVRDDQTGAIGKRIQELARVAARHPNKLVMNNLINGDDSTLGLDYTGEAFYNDTHTARGQQSSTQDNNLSGAGTSTANVASDLNSALSALMGFVAENAEPFREDVTDVVVAAGPDLMKPLKEAVRAQMISQTSNVQFDGIRFRFIFTQRLGSDDANDYYVNDVGNGVKPLLFQDREPLEFAALDSDDSDTAFNKHQYRYKATATYASGYGLWQNSVKVVNS